MAEQNKNFVIREVDGITYIRFINRNLTGTEDVERISRDIYDLLVAGARRVVLDFKHVDYISSAALGLLIALSQKITELKGGLVLAHPDNIMPLLKISRTERLFKTATDGKTAMEMLGEV